MEGLIPLVFKAIKNRGRQQHRRSLSVQTPYFFVVDDQAAHQQYTSTTASTAAPVHGSATESNYLYITPVTPPAVNLVQNVTTDIDDHHRLHHRRHKSVSVVSDRSYSFGIAENQGSNYCDNSNQLEMTKVDDHRRVKKLVRFRSHRSSLFSCISGAA